MTRRALIGLSLALIAASVIVLRVQTPHDGYAAGKVDIAPRPAAAACPGGSRCLPDLSWLDTSGITHTRAELAGRIVVVNFWATWCHPCEREIPDFARVAARYGPQVVMLGVMMDSPPPDSSTLLNFMSDHDMTYPIIPVTQDIELAFQYPANYPTTYVFDRAGRQRTWKLRPMSESELTRVIERILRE
jgi:thiol-disulfide isomerase/thioredoxin